MFVKCGISGIKNNVFKKKDYIENRLTYNASNRLKIENTRKSRMEKYNVL